MLGRENVEMEDTGFLDFITKGTRFEPNFPAKVTNSKSNLVSFSGWGAGW